MLPKLSVILFLAVIGAPAYAQTVPIDHFPGVILDAPLQGGFDTGDPVLLSGTVSDAAIAQILFRFTPEAGGDPVLFFLDVSMGRFDRSVLFDHSQADVYTLEVFAGQQGESLAFVGSSSGFVVNQGSGAISLPEKYFATLNLDVRFATELSTGQVLNIAGRFDAGVTQVLFSFVPESGEERVDFFFDVVDGRFDRVVIFHHSQSGTYALEVFAGQPGESLSFLGSFAPVRISRGSGVVELPVGLFPGITLEQTIPTAFSTGEALRIGGGLADPSLRATLFRFRPDSGGENVEFFIDVRGGNFGRTVLFDHSQAGTYTLEVFAAEGRESMAFVGSFGPFQIDQGEGVIVVPEEFFGGFTLEQGFTTELQTDGVFPFEGTVDADVVGLRIDIVSLADDAVRSIEVGIEADRSFRLPLRLLPRELGDFSFIAVLELANRELRRSGELAIRGVDPPGPDMVVGALALSLLPGGTGTIPLANRGELALELGTAEVEGPYEVAAQPTAIPSGERGELVVAYVGSGGDDGMLTILSDDPVRPRVKVALEGLAGDGGGGGGGLQRLRADSAGLLSVPWDFADSDLLLALYSASVSGADSSADYTFSVGGSEPIGKRAGSAGGSAGPWVQGGEPAANRRYQLEAILRQRERELAIGIGQLGWPAAKPVQVGYQVGDQRSLVFPEWPTVPRQTVFATVVAVNDRVVAFVQKDLRAAADNVGSAQIQKIIDQFREDYDQVVGTFGMPSDVDGDGRIAFLFTHLVDDVGVGGFYNAESVLPVEAGGAGDLTDLMFLSPTQGLSTYRTLLIHEFQHLVNFNQHVLVRSGEAEASWLNEGLSHLSEDLVDDGFVTGGVARLIDDFLAEPWSAGLQGEASFDSRKRGASYLFVRSLVDRLGEGVVRRLVQTGLADRDNVEDAAGERFEDLLASWAAQLFASGNGLVGHRRLNYEFEFLRTKGGRGFRQPATLSYRLGDDSLAGSLRSRGVSFVRVRGAGAGSIDIQTDPEARIGAVVLSIPGDFAAAIRLPVRLFAGITLSYPMPALARAEDELTVTGAVDDASSNQVLFRLAHESGADTLRFSADVEGGQFEIGMPFSAADVGSYLLEVFAGESGQGLPLLGRYEPFEVLPEDAILPVRITSVSALDSGPGLFALSQNHPNPFNASTAIDFQLPQAGVVRLEIRNASGQLVEVLTDGWRASGAHTTDWKASGRGTGVYFYRLFGEGFQETHKMVLVR